ncbi:NYN domain-containing protein [Salinimonas chungwhensis]|jgi:uncharacterized protein (TIGR00288 family)|uniref:NYN domain-containing protein n=1 Tax=Salinimonas chungwhensis TaxID=265425 RepID=UPI001E501587|nr:NYN domain-containing protein [Salinimonas chungwhensis]
MMKNLDVHKKVAVLIDADNAQLARLSVILDEISAHGHVLIKRAYGDWSADTLKNWKKPLNELAIQPIQQFAYTTGKNATDASMIIDAMDLLYSDRIDAFALVSSDSDFTKLASRLRESEKFVFGVGEKKTPVSFRNACDDFVFTENLDSAQSSKTEKTVTSPNSISSANGAEALIPAFLKAWELYQNEDGWVNAGPAGSFLKRAKPDFDPRTYGGKKVTDVLASLSSVFEMSRQRGKGTTSIVRYRPKMISI